MTDTDLDLSSDLEIDERFDPHECGEWALVAVLRQDVPILIAMGKTITRNFSQEAVFDIVHRNAAKEHLEAMELGPQGFLMAQEIMKKWLRECGSST